MATVKPQTRSIEEHPILSGEAGDCNSAQRHTLSKYKVAGGHKDFMDDPELLSSLKK